MSDTPQYAPPYKIVQRRLTWAIVITNSICALVPHVYLPAIDPRPDTQPFLRTNHRAQDQRTGP